MIKPQENYTDCSVTMVQLWVVISLIAATFSVAILGAAFSIVGLGKLFTGAVLAVWLMAGSLELAKFVIAAFLHQTWDRLNFLLKSYLLVATVILSVITSMGIFGFLSDAYEQASTVLEEETIKLEALKADDSRYFQEIARLYKSVDEIPANRVTKRLAARVLIEPAVLDLNKKREKIAGDLTISNLKILEVKKKVGPLIYIARAFSTPIDTVVKYLILLLVFVFDPLAICMVVAVSEALKIRREAHQAPQGSGSSEYEKPKQKQTIQEEPKKKVNKDTFVITPDTVVASPTDHAVKMRFADEDDEAA